MATNFKHESLHHLHQTLSDFKLFSRVEYLPLLSSQSYQDLHRSLDELILDSLAHSIEKGRQREEEDSKEEVKGENERSLRAEMKSFRKSAEQWEK